MDAHALYKYCIRRQWKNVLGQLYQAKALNVELNLSATTDEAEQWVKVRLLFVHGIAQPEKSQHGKHDWAIFLNTEIILAT